MAANKLYIYDSTSEIDRDQAAKRFTGDARVVTIAATGVADLHTQLGNLVTNKKTFKRLLIQTHGGPGRVRFNNDRITADVLRAEFAGKSYHLLFPNRSKLYFDGCNVADGSAGWDFLKAAGEVFLKDQGGLTMGYTSLGFALWGGHTVHLWGSLRFIDFRAGAVESSRFDGGNASMPEMIEAAGKLEAFDD